MSTDYEGWLNTLQATPGTCGGRVRFPGTRLEPMKIGQLVASGAWTEDQVLESWPQLSGRDVGFAVRYFHQGGVKEHSVLKQLRHWQRVRRRHRRMVRRTHEMFREQEPHSRGWVEWWVNLRFNSQKSADSRRRTRQLQEEWIRIKGGAR